ncbi:hypothetical protein NDA17_005640 [Ustilago hordei]|nr:hypothetical protein NDA17_005640 [Ustilago hordei]
MASNQIYMTCDDLVVLPMLYSEAALDQCGYNITPLSANTFAPVLSEEHILASLMPHEASRATSPLLQSYTWVPHDDASEEPEPDDVTPPTVRPYSHQRGVELQQSPLDSSSYGCKWDQLMSEIENMGKIIIDLDAIAANLHAELDITSSQAKNSTEDPTSLAVMCSGTGTIMISNHHLDQMAFATTVMNGATLIASGQQMQSADGILLEPLSLNEAKAHDDWHWWKEAMDSEMVSMDKMNIFELANIPMDSKLISVQWVYKLKLDTQHRAMRYKAQLVAQGYAQCQGLNYDQMFSPVVWLQTVQMLLAIVCRYGLHIIQLNVSTTFLNGKINKDVYI